MHPVQFHNCKSEKFVRNDRKRARLSVLLFRLQRQLNNALQQAGIYTINMTVFNVEEAVDSLG